MKLSELIRQYRTENDLTMDAFAIKAGLTKQYISMLEKNKNSNSGKPISPSLKTYKNIAIAMGISLEELLKKN